ncbi:MAG: dTDP-4-dehydrorhamnose 3,5-epimerase [Bacteroidia bacterium]|nr:dTDP-4-dehydrorhamnose 3,5-epimerase [Bacteroidia bacterium]
MKYTATEFEGLNIIQPKLWKDERGYFYETYNERAWAKACGNTNFVQDNQAKSSRGVIRGLHYQKGTKAQAKLVRVIHGEVLDVVLDLRKNQKTYGKWFAMRLSAENHTQLFIPRGFAHGYLTLSQTAIFTYKCDNFYSKEAEGGIRFNDPGLAIDWGINISQAIVSEKDLNLPEFGKHDPIL